jgi:hypothetical protein
VSLDLDDLLEFGAESALKAFIRKDLIRAGIDLDNWQTKSASVLGQEPLVVLLAVCG